MVVLKRIPDELQVCMSGMSVRPSPHFAVLCCFTGHSCDRLDRPTRSGTIAADPISDSHVFPDATHSSLPI